MKKAKQKEEVVSEENREERLMRLRREYSELKRGCREIKEALDKAVARAEERLGDALKEAE